MIIGIDASRAFIQKRTGTENYSRHLIFWLTKLDRINQYRLYLKNRQRIDFGLPPNFQVVRIPLPRLWTQAGLAVRSFLDPLDVLFIPAHTLPIIRRPGLKTVVTIHGLESEYLPEHYQWPQKLFLNCSTHYAVKKADQLIAVSAWTRDQLVARLGANPKKIKVIYEGVEEAKFRIPDSKFQIERVKRKYQLERDYVLFVGTIQPRKNLVRLIQAFGKFSEQTSRLFSLVLVGKPGWQYDKIYATPAQLGIAGRVKFLGHVPQKDLVALYRGAGVFCLPSLMEGFGLPVLEAMAAGVPVIAGQAGALPEVVSRAGLLVNPEKVEEIAAALELILKNRTLRQALKKKGLKRAKKLSWQKTAQKTLELIQSLESKTIRSTG
ncbi:MAG: glycosyltransferase family 4 protein [Candidatus Pacebacteria bacterium]|nr:glycosyltransferase family 4 protein [Candidatus Paceibacterota bacterium]